MVMLVTLLSSIFIFDRILLFYLLSQSPAPPAQQHGDLARTSLATSWQSTAPDR